jgi:hypothetical protein
MFCLKRSAPSSEKPKKEVEPAVEPAAPSYSAFKTTSASMTLHGSDSISLLQFPQEVIDAIRELIKKRWIKGIQKERIHFSSYEFKLHGEPWNGSFCTNSESIPSRILIREILAYLFSVGWILHASNNDMLIFRQQQTLPPESDWISVTFDTDRLRLIGASTELIALFRGMLQSMGLLQDEFWKEEQNNAWEFNIKWRPRSSWDEQKVARSLLPLRIVETLEAHGWSLYSDARLRMFVPCGNSSIRISFSQGWFCVRDKQWAPGMATILG